MKLQYIVINTKKKVTKLELANKRTIASKIVDIITQMI